MSEWGAGVVMDGAGFSRPGSSLFKQQQSPPKTHILLRIRSRHLESSLSSFQKLVSESKTFYILTFHIAINEMDMQACCELSACREEGRFVAWSAR